MPSDEVKMNPFNYSRPFLICISQFWLTKSDSRRRKNMLFLRISSCCIIPEKKAFHLKGLSVKLGLMAVFMANAKLCW